MVNFFLRKIDDLKKFLSKGQNHLSKRRKKNSFFIKLIGTLSGERQKSDRLHFVT